MHSAGTETKQTPIRAILRVAAGIIASVGALLAKLEIRDALRRLYLTPATALLIALCVILCLWLLFEIFAPLAEVQPPKTTLVKRASIQYALKKFVPPPLEQFAVIDERAAFSPLRRAVRTAKEKEALAQLRPPPSFVLVGVILSGTERIAITRAPGANESVNVTIGQTIEGWEVSRIEPDHIELHSGDATVQLPLYPPSTQAPMPNPNALAGQQTPSPPTPN